MTDKIQELKKHIQSGNLELARFDENNKPVKMQISELEQKTSELNKHQKIYKLVQNLSWQEKFEWVNTRRLKGNHIFKTETPQKALECYLESLIGLELKNNDPQKNAQVKLDLQFPILMNMAACFYKLKMYQKGIQICDQVLNDPLGKDFYQALYKKAYFLYEMGSFEKAKQEICDKGREIVLELNKKLESNQSQKKVSRQDVKQLFTKILSKTREQKSMYRRIFFQDEDDLQSPNQSKIQQPVLQYNESIFSKTISWIKDALESCYRAKPRQYHLREDQEKSRLLQNKKK